MKKIILLFLTLTSVSLTTSGQDKVKISIDASKSECEKKFDKLRSDIDNTIQQFQKGIKNDSATIVKALDILKSSLKYQVDAIKTINTDCYNSTESEIGKQVETIQRKLDDLNQTLSTTKISLKNCEDNNLDELSKNLLSKMDKLFQDLKTMQESYDKEKRISDSLSVVVQTKNSVITKLRKDSIKLLTIQLSQLQNDKKIIDAKLEVYQKPESFFNIGLAFGPNFDTKGDYLYFVKNDSSIYEKNVGVGANGMVSAVASFKFPLFVGKRKEKLKERLTNSNKFRDNVPLPGTARILLNVPLTETLLADKETAIGLFNKKIALGLGFGIDLIESATGKQAVTFFYIMNFSTVKRLDLNYYSNYKFTETYPQRIDISKYETYSQINVTHYFGFYISLF